VSRGQRGGPPTVVNLSFLDRSYLPSTLQFIIIIIIVFSFLFMHSTRNSLTHIHTLICHKPVFLSKVK
jgi:hypothetical protein